ncbi:hypothetical protein [Ekhidna sp.]|uniref:hypothetical protein n=1 Tax=Ekhidna sp. TaxID=2608089 RepID=UPI003B50E4E6
MKFKILILTVFVFFVACDNEVKAPRLESFLESENLFVSGHKILIFSATDCSNCIINKMKNHFASYDYIAAIIVNNPYMANDAVNEELLDLINLNSNSLIRSNNIDILDELAEITENPKSPYLIQIDNSSMKIKALFED